MTTSRILIIVFSTLLALCVVAGFWRETAPDDGRTHLVWASDNNPTRTEQIKAFNAEHPDLRLTLDFANSDSQKLLLQCASGVGPDIFDYNNERLQMYVSAGVLWDITEAAEKGGFSARDNLWPSGYAAVTSNGRQYGFPCNIGTNILIYNKNVFDDLGLPYPQGTMTWEEFSALSRQLTIGLRKQKNNAFAVQGVNWQLLFDSLRGEFFNEKGELQIADSDDLRRAFAMHREFLFTEGFMPSSIELKTLSAQGGWGASSLNHFAAGRFAMVATGYWALISFSRNYQQQLNDSSQPRLIRLGAVALPRFADRPPGYRIQSRVAGINAHSPNREKALAFFTYLAGPTYSRLLNEGIDWLPGNPIHASLGEEPGPADLDRAGMQQTTVEAMAHGYIQRTSPFLLTTDVLRVLNGEIARLESNPQLKIDDLLQSADRQLRTLMRRNIEREPVLQALYQERTGRALP